MQPGAEGPGRPTTRLTGRLCIRYTVALMSGANGFLWGVASSAFQYEGQIRNDMTEWEAAGRFRQDGHDPRYESACNHWERWEEDFDRLRELGVNAYRFSMEWSRLQPERGRFDQAAMDRYESQVDRLLEHGIEPMLTLHHFTHPAWFHRDTPWHTPEALEAFDEFTSAVLRRVGDRIRWYVTFNEPLAWAVAAYGDGRFPPGERDLGRMMQVVGRILVAHRRAYDRIKEQRSDSRIGMAHSCVSFAPCRSWHPLDRGLTSRIDYFFNRMIPDAVRSGVLKMNFPALIDHLEAVPLSNQIDFWGVNYYYRLHVKFRLSRSRPFELRSDNRRGIGITDMGWEIYPEGLEEAVRRLSAHDKPVVITENGIATDDDELRIAFLREHLGVVDRLRQGGINLQGYFYWSLLDNYEWLVGTHARFGLYKVHYDNGLAREIRTSGRYYARHIGARTQSGVPSSLTNS